MAYLSELTLPNTFIIKKGKHKNVNKNNQKEILCQGRLKIQVYVEYRVLLTLCSNTPSVS